jgi:hypothetical protein
MVLSTEQRSLPTPPDIHNQIDDKNEVSYRPAIRIKRISLAEAENFLPPIWKTSNKIPQDFSLFIKKFHFFSKIKTWSKKRQTKNIKILFH